MLLKPLERKVFMKRFILPIFCFLLAVSLTACTGGSDTTESKKEDIKNDAASMTSSIMSGVQSVADGITGDTNVGDTGKLRDGEYVATSDTYDSDGYKARVKIEVENGKVAEVECDAIDKNGNEKTDNDNHNDWEDKIELFEDAVVMRGLDKLEFAEDGTVAGIDGMDLNVGEYKKLISEALNKAKKNS